MRIFTFNQLFEYKTGEKLKTRWTENDNIIALYYEKFGLGKLGISDNQVEKFANTYIGSNEPSLKMEAKNIRYVIGMNQGDEEPEGLSRYSKMHVKVVDKYDSLSEPELRQIVENILDNTTDEQKANNIKQAESQNQEVLRKREAKRKEKEDRYKEDLASGVVRRGRPRNIPSMTHIMKKDKPEDITKDMYGRPISKLDDIKSDDSTFVQVGDVLDHRKFGRGEILSVNGNIIEIDFFESELGTKKLIFKPELFNWTPDSF